MPRRVVGRRHDLAFERTIRRRRPDAAAQRDDESAGAAKREAADGLRHRHRRVETRCGIEAMQRRRVYVDPIENLLTGRPYGALAQTGTSVENAGEGAHISSANEAMMRIVQEYAAPGASNRM